MSTNNVSTRKKPRILVVDVQSATLSSKKRMATYALLWIDPSNKFQTKSSYSMPGKKPIWNEKFVFSVRDEFIHSRDSPITIELYRARKHFPDKRIGTAILNLATVFGDEPKKESVHEVVGAKETVYDTDDEREVEEDDHHQLQYDCSPSLMYDDDSKEEFRRFVEGDDRWANVFAADDAEGDDEQQQPEEEEEEDEKEKQKKNNNEMKGDANLEIKKGSENRGMVSVELKVSGGFADCVGKFNFHNWGMRYEEFMGNPGEDSTRMKKKKPFLCFAAPSTQERSSDIK